MKENYILCCFVRHTNKKPISRKKTLIPSLYPLALYISNRFTVARPPRQDILSRVTLLLKPGNPMSLTFRTTSRFGPVRSCREPFRLWLDLLHCQFGIRDKFDAGWHIERVFSIYKYWGNGNKWYVDIRDFSKYPNGFFAIFLENTRYFKHSIVILTSVV